MPEFDVRDGDNHVELLPDFFTGELDREEKKQYQQLKDELATKNGGFIYGGNKFEPGERVSLEEVVEAVLLENDTLADRLAEAYLSRY